MASKIATEPGYYNGKFLKAGTSYDDQVGSEQAVENVIETDLDKMTKDDLIEEAVRRGVEVKASDTKAEILAALKG
ncbi:hypothetical protein [Pseudorhizobium flavum]|uniref:hypothetical protein n=1 Tax=Pseudorhizobium flavum TaxID=1335061 RepID=UPI002492156B|nr:hypothetical protein [Pseudorhizobium flavum]